MEEGDSYDSGASFMNSDDEDEERNAANQAYYTSIYTKHVETLVRVARKLDTLMTSRYASPSEIQETSDQLASLYKADIPRPYNTDDRAIFLAIDLREEDDVFEILDATTHLPELLLLMSEYDDNNTVLGAVFKRMRGAHDYDDAVDSDIHSEKYNKDVVLVMRVLDAMLRHQQLVDVLNVKWDETDRVNDLVHALFDGSLVNYVLNQIDDNDLVNAIEINKSETVLSVALYNTAAGAADMRVSSADSILARMDITDQSHREFLSTKSLQGMGQRACTYLHLLEDDTAQFASNLVNFITDERMFIDLMSHRNSEGLTPLVHAYFRSNTEVFRLLVTRLHELAVPAENSGTPTRLSLIHI